MQRLVLQYGHTPPIPETAQALADQQNQERGRDIAALQVEPGGRIQIDNDVFTAMTDYEPVYLVAHGRPAVGNIPARLQYGRGDSYLRGGDIAAIVDYIRTRLVRGLEPSKRPGSFKLEACMTSLSRNTRAAAAAAGNPAAKQASLVADTLVSLKREYGVADVDVTGNLGFSTGTVYDPAGVGNLSPEDSEVGLLDPITVELAKTTADTSAAQDRREALLDDALNIVQTQQDRINRSDQAGRYIGETCGAPGPVAVWLQTQLLLLRKLSQDPGKQAKVHYDRSIRVVTDVAAILVGEAKAGGRL